MPNQSVHFRFSTQFLKDLDWLGSHYGDLDRTNTLRVIVAEAKARKQEEMRLAKQAKKASKSES
jgi:hypothetical protein